MSRHPVCSQGSERRYGCAESVSGLAARAPGISGPVLVGGRSGGTLAGFARMLDAFLMSGDVVMRKAQSTAAAGLPAEVVEQAIAQEAPRVREGLQHAGFNFIRGGLPLFDGDAIIGAIGVCGGSESQHIECAQVGNDTLKR